MRQQCSRVLFAAAPAVLLLAACGGGSDSTPPPARPFVSLTTGEAAQVVIGQADFDSGSPNRGLPSPAANTLNQPRGNPTVIDGRLYLPDTMNHRVLGFDAIPTTNGAPADFVLGQADMASATWGLSATKLLYPEAVSSSDGKLVLADYANRRVLVWNAIPAATGVAPDVVVGQADFASADSACDDKTLFLPEGVMAVNGKLIVSDSSHNRVLVWNVIPTTNGASADLVLGQPGFDTCVSGLSDSSMTYPSGVWSDGVRLLVVDTQNARVLLWNSFPTANGQAADVVLGQVDFVSNAGAVTRAGMLEPVSVSSNGTQIAVADASAARVLVWNSFPAENGAEADVVLGQQDFVSNLEGRSTNGMSTAWGVLFHGDMLLVGDAGNHRYLVFR